MPRCRHTKKRSFVVILNPTQPDELPVAVMTIRCGQCDMRFEFVGVQTSEHVKLSEDRLQLRVSFSESLGGMVQ